MAITESDQKVIQDLFMDAAADLLKKEREILEQILLPTNARLTAIEARLTALEVQVAQLVRIESIEQRLKALEETANH